ncbi:MAG TPA: anti-sigma factor [Allosphingosinicella sp.]|nr:anti-sigma factor [Allosphingosinicella sp.]
MTDLRPEEERDLLAAEYALGVLEGEALADARRLAAGDPAFSDAVARWEERLAPLLGDIAEAEPGPELRARILAALPVAPRGDDNVVVLRRSIGRWRLATGAMTALAASLALILVIPRSVPPPAAPAPQVPAAAPMLVASLTATDANTSLSVAFDRRDASLAIVPNHLTFPAGHDHQLWIIPEGQAPVSLGVVRLDAARRMTVPREMMPHFRTRATMAVSVEPVGGSPTGQPSGPVIASGALTTI